MTAKSPRFKCKVCGAMHGGMDKDVCPDCKSKDLKPKK
jgi:hypothetical protein